MPEDISETGMMVGAMVMAKPSLAGGLPGAMAPPEGMTAVAMGSVLSGENSSKDMMGQMMQGMNKNQIGEAMKKNNLETKKNLKSDQQIDDKEKNNSNTEDS